MLDCTAQTTEAVSVRLRLFGPMAARVEKARGTLKIMFLWLHRRVAVRRTALLSALLGAYSLPVNFSQDAG